MPVTVGQPAPDFTLYDADKQKRRLSELRGKNVVLAFLPGAFTSVCDGQAAQIARVLVGGARRCRRRP